MKSHKIWVVINPNNEAVGWYKYTSHTQLGALRRFKKSKLGLRFMGVDEVVKLGFKCMIGFVKNIK